MEYTPHILNNIVIKFEQLENKIYQLEKQLLLCNQPIQFINCYYNNFPKTDKNILSESKIMVKRDNMIGQSILDKITYKMHEADLLIEQKQLYMRLFKDFEYFDDDLIDFISNKHDQQIVIPENKVMKVWRDQQLVSTYYTGRYQPQILKNCVAIWMGDMECINDTPNNLDWFLQ